MKALILNSGLGSRMGDITKTHPKCMTPLNNHDTILSRQLKMLVASGITEVVITTGPFPKLLGSYCKRLRLPLHYSFVNNPDYAQTNYIYSIYLARKVLQDDILLMHGDLVFSADVLGKVLKYEYSCMTVSSTVPLPEKDFKAVLDGQRIKKVGIEFFEQALTAQPLYKLYKINWMIWLANIVKFCEAGQVKCYAENAFNEVSNQCLINGLDVKDELCNEIDNLEDLKTIKERLNK